MGWRSGGQSDDSQFVILELMTMGYLCEMADGGRSIAEVAVKVKKNKNTTSTTTQLHYFACICLGKTNNSEHLQLN